VSGLVRVGLEFFHPWTNHAGLYLARERGWYADAGVEVDVNGLDHGRGDTVAHLARRDLDLALVPLNRLYAARLAGVPVRSVAAVNHRPLESLLTLEAGGITRPRHLAGRRVGLPSSGRLKAMVRDVVARDGGDPDEVTFVETGMREALVEDVREGRFDAAFGGVWAWEPLLDGGADVVVLPLDELGGPRYHGYVLAAHEATVAERHDELAAVLQAAGRGYAAAADDPDAVVAIFDRVAPIFPSALFRRSLALLAPSWTAPDRRWGVHRPELLGPYADWLHAQGQLATAIGAIDEIFTDDLVVPA
jgi:NitT/TauT family transport system substrate-binding protein